ncbi:MAG TPA: type II and III secretion system protein [Terriglobales bacterium]|nr:type II and III secretion system protein [Terriglobales bacterium]
MPGSTSVPSTDASSSQPPATKKNPATNTAPNTVILPTISRREAAEAKRQFQAGVKLKQKGHLEAAFDKFCSAAELDPRNVNYLTAREFTREELAMRALEAGNKAMLQHNDIVALADFQHALQYDPTNDYALQRLRDAMPEPEPRAQTVSVVEKSIPIQLLPVAKRQDFHFRGDSYALLTEVARAYGITAEFDDSVKHLHVHYDIQNVNFFTAMGAANDVTKTFWVALSPTQVLLLADTVENHRNFDRMGLRTFYLTDLNDRELTEMTNALRVLLNLRYVSLVRAASAITIRADLPVLNAASELIRSLTTGTPEVLLDIRVYAVSTSLAQSLGTALPTQFTMFNISPALLTSLGPSAQNLVNQLIASGGINQANSSAISALLAQLQNSASSSILTTPFVIFGGGLTLFGLNAGGQGVSPTFSLNTSSIRSLEHATLRSSHNVPAVLKIGERYPIINATFAPIYNSSAIASVIGNQSYIAPFPSFDYEDLGLILKATPLIHADGDVTMKLELQIRSLGTTDVNGIPIINNREYSGSISVKNGESSVVTGMIDMNDTRSITGFPFLGQVPGLGYGASTHNKNVAQDELLVVITPHILRLPEHASFAVELPPDN